MTGAGHGASPVSYRHNFLVYFIFIYLFISFYFFSLTFCTLVLTALLLSAGKKLFPFVCLAFSAIYDMGLSGGAMVSGKNPVPTNLANSKARAYCASSRCGWALFEQFFSRLSYLFFLLLSGRRPD